jgi:peptide/nickel transport system permease protein
MVALIVLALLIVLVLLSNHITPFDPDIQDLPKRLQGPSLHHWLGTDGFGRDTFSRILVGLGVTFEAALIALGVAVVFGVPTGLIAGYLGGAVDAVLSRINDGVLALPPLLLALAIVGVAGPGLVNAMLAIGAVIAPRFYRITRAETEAIKREPFIEAVRADGTAWPRILMRHILPNAMGPLLVQASFSIGLIISSEASLSFLGLGVQPPQSSLGSMIKDAFGYIRLNGGQIIAPTTMIVVVILCFFIVGDALRDAFGRG